MAMKLVEGKKGSVTKPKVSKGNKKSSTSAVEK
jgi:hypothetical protein